MCNRIYFSHAIQYLCYVLEGFLNLTVYRVCDFAAYTFHLQLIEHIQTKNIDYSYSIINELLKYINMCLWTFLT